MYWILFVMGGLVAVAAALIVGGLTIPRRHTIARGMTVRAPQETVWALVRDVTGYPSWRHELQSVETESGADTHTLEWTESTGRSARRLGATCDEPPVRFAARVLDVDLPPNEWAWSIRPAADGATRVVLTETGDVGNPIARILAHTAGHRRTVDGMLQALAAQVGEPAPRLEDAAPEPVPG